MREADRPLPQLEHALVERRGERVLADPGLAELRRGQPRLRRDQDERLVRRPRERVEPRRDELLQPPGHRQRLRRVAHRVLVAERPRELEGVHRVPARDLVQPEERRARHRPPELVAEDAVDRADAERPDADALDPVRAERLLDRGPPVVLAEPARPDDEHVVAETPQREAERGLGRRVEPLQVVDRDDQAVLRGKQLQRAPDRDAEGHRVDGPAPRLLQEQRHLERAAAGRRQAGSTSSRASSNRSPRPACPSVRSDSTGRAVRTRSPRARARSTVSRQSVDFPIPASPSSAIPAGPLPGARRSRTASRMSRSSSLPTTSRAVCIGLRRSAAPSSRIVGTIRSTSSGPVRQFTIAGRNATLPACTVVPK